ncbi:hypothetical protein TcWFU_005066 [Taenia crassiceps]|uniref:F-box domain-containing protein n=1 Tax=Taenia crassiceps TaxID=6207 RepID=A0ABR4Q2C3_9CEST
MQVLPLTHANSANSEHITSGQCVALAMAEPVVATMETLPPYLRMQICAYLDATDIVNVCEAMPIMRSVLESGVIKDILRSYVRHMEWVDAELCCMLYSTIAVVEKQADMAVSVSASASASASAPASNSSVATLTAASVAAAAAAAAEGETEAVAEGEGEGEGEGEEEEEREGERERVRVGLGLAVGVGVGDVDSKDKGGGEGEGQGEAEGEREGEGEGEREGEGEVLYRAIRSYQAYCQPPPKHLSPHLPNCGRTIYFLMLARSVIELDLYVPLMRTLQDKRFTGGYGLSRGVSFDVEPSRSVACMPDFRVHLTMAELGGKDAQYAKSLKTSTLLAFDSVVYMLHPARQRCHECGLPLALKRLIHRITNIADDKQSRLPMLFILHVESEKTGTATSRGEQFESLVASIHSLDEMTLRRCGGCGASLPLCNWWRVCRLRQQNGVFANMYEAFGMAALQIANTDAERSSQHLCA